MAEEEEHKRKRKRSKKTKKEKKKKTSDDGEDGSGIEPKVETPNEGAAGAAAHGKGAKKDTDADLGKHKSEAAADKNDGEEGEEGRDGEEEEAAIPAKRKRKRKRKKKGGNSASEGGEGGGASTDEMEKKFASTEHTVYVEGIPFDCTEENVREFFATNGVEDVIQMRLPRWQDSGRLRGYGHVVFDSTASRSKALADLNGLNLGSRYVTVKEPNAPRPGTTASAASGGTGKPRDQPDGCRTVFVKNLPYDATEETILDAFRPCGKILDGGVRISRNYATRQSKGFAYVEFKNPEGANSAVHRAAKAFGLVVGGRPCFVDYDEGSMKGSYRTGDGKLWNKEHGKKAAGGRGGRGGGGFQRR